MTWQKLPVLFVQDPLIPKIPHVLLLGPQWVGDYVSTTAAEVVSASVALAALVTEVVVTLTVINPSSAVVTVTQVVVALTQAASASALAVSALPASSSLRPPRRPPPAVALRARLVATLLEVEAVEALQVLLLLDPSALLHVSEPVEVLEPVVSVVSVDST